MFAVSKIFWWFAEPSNILLALLVVGTALLWSRWRRLGRRLVAAAATFALIVAILPFGDWLTGTLENRFPPVRVLPASATGIISVGGAVNQFITVDRDQTALSGGVERLTVFIMLARQRPSLKLVPAYP